MQDRKIIIIGAGLAGLTLAYILKQRDIYATILEARDRIGGRILTRQITTGPTIEMGATWLGNQHTLLQGLITELGLEIFEQALGATAFYEPISTSPPQIVQLPPNDQPSYRIVGGTNKLIDALADKLDDNQIVLSQVVRQVASEGDKIILKTDDGQYFASNVISTLPPYLLSKTIDFRPNLPSEMQSILSQTHTWMGDSIKIGLGCKKPFWNANDSSGTIFSNVGPIPEMYDHSNFENSRHALKGFLNGAYHAASKIQRQNAVINQLKKYYGESVKDFECYEEVVWRHEPFTFSEYTSSLLPHQNNGHPIFRQALFDGRFIVAGSETASQFPGYMEGAIRSAEDVSKMI